MEKKKFKDLTIRDAFLFAAVMTDRGDLPEASGTFFRNHDCQRSGTDREDNGLSFRISRSTPRRLRRG